MKIINNVNLKDMKNIICIMTGIMLFLYVSCKEEARVFYYDKNAPAPATVSEETIDVDDFAGYSVIRFRAPADDNLLCIRAEYEPAPGVIRETKASRYTDTLTVEGFGAAGNYTVKLFSVGKNNKESNPVEITVSPLTPPVIEAFPSLDLVQTFGGVIGSFTNVHDGYLTVVLKADTTHSGIYETLQSFVINDHNARFSFVGLKSEPTDFSVYLKDRWGNKSDVKYFNLNPLYEAEIDKSTWTRYELASDHIDPAENHPGYKFEGAWDGITRVQFNNVFICSPTSFPATFTINLGKSVVLSRIKVYQWYKSEFLSHNMKEFECWGSNAARPGDDLLGGDWTLLAKCRSSKPSGDTGPVTEDDRQYGRAGENYFISITDETPNPYVPIKYFRIRAFSNWTGVVAPGIGMICIPEITLYGR